MLSRYITTKKKTRKNSPIDHTNQYTFSRTRPIYHPQSPGPNVLYRGTATAPMDAPIPPPHYPVPFLTLVIVWPQKFAHFCMYIFLLKYLNPLRRMIKNNPSRFDVLLSVFINLFIVLPFYMNKAKTILEFIRTFL